jgi:PAS domain S-box-containing protein
VKKGEMSQEYFSQEISKLNHRINQLEKTKHEITEEVLRVSEEKYRDLFENANDLIQCVDIDCKFLYINRKWLEVLGYTGEEVKNLTLWNILRKDQLNHCSELFKQVCNGKVLNQVQTVFVAKNGKEIYVEGNVNSQFKDGKFIATRAIFRDITVKSEESIPLNGKGKILVTDDEENVQETVKEILTHLGFEAACAANGEETLNSYKKAKETGMPFDAVIMDLTIKGGMDGKEAIGELLKIDSEVKAIVSSGYSNDPIISNFNQYGFRGNVPKPYEVEELVKVLQEVLSMKG